MDENQEKKLPDESKTEEILKMVCITNLIFLGVSLLLFLIVTLCLIGMSNEFQNFIYYTCGRMSGY